MAITEYFKDDKKFFCVYVNVRGRKNKKIRKQKKVKEILSLSQAIKEERKLIREITEEVLKLEGEGLSRKEVIDRWVVVSNSKFILNTQNEFTRKDHFNRLLRYTSHWLKIPASKIGKAEGRQLINSLYEQGTSTTLIKKIKNSINVVYSWGIEEGYITNPNGTLSQSPVYGLKLPVAKGTNEKVPPILTIEEIRLMLLEAKIKDHPWYLCKRSKTEKSTKSGYWRNVNISPQLKEVLITLQQVPRKDDLVLTRFGSWLDGSAGKILRDFLKSIGIEKYVTFHTLRACFATHLLSTGAEAMKVMKMGGWSDLKTFQIYVRMAGVDIKGVSDPLDVLPTENIKNVIKLR